MTEINIHWTSLSEAAKICTSRYRMFSSIPFLLMAQSLSIVSLLFFFFLWRRFVVNENEPAKMLQNVNFANLEVLEGVLTREKQGRWSWRLHA